MERLLSYAFKKGAFAASVLTAAPGDVFAWSYPPPIEKRKYHLCVSHDYDFVFLNTPKDKNTHVDFPIRAHDMRFLKPTRQQFSAVSCREFQTVGSLAKFRLRKPQHLGNLATPVLFEVLKHMCRLPTFTLEDVERLSDVIETMGAIITLPKPRPQPRPRPRSIHSRPTPTPTAHESGAGERTE